MGGVTPLSLVYVLYCAISAVRFALVQFFLLKTVDFPLFGANLEIPDLKWFDFYIVLDSLLLSCVSGLFNIYKSGIIFSQIISLEPK